MSNRVAAGQAFRIAAFAGLMLGSASLAGCSPLGLGMGGGDVTGSTGSVNSIGGQQAMPSSLKPIGSATRVAEGPYTPPEDIEGGSGGLVTGSAPTGSIQSSPLPPLTGNSNMPAQPQTQYAPMSAPKVASLGAPPTNLSVIPASAYTHVIASGESLYTIARHYDVSAQAIMQANGIASADKIFVGQRIIIPGRADLLAAMDKGSSKTASITPISPVVPVNTPNLAPGPKPLELPTKIAAVTPKVAPVDAAPGAQKPVQVASIDPTPVKIAPVEPAMSGADKFRWPVSGKVSTDFIASKGTGIDIDAPAGTAVRAAENGTVIYVGSGVEGYGNLILIRHPNGYVSAYAHLGSTSVNKGDAVNRGDSIGLVGMTGSVTHPLLHFELRQGATPVDPIPLLAG